jgi:hypothetical protein
MNPNLIPTTFEKQAYIKAEGYNWTGYDEENSGLQNNYVNSLAFDKHGNMWIGKHRYLAEYRNGGVILE